MAETTELLERWRRGEDRALTELLDRHLPWVRERVREQLGRDLRAKMGSEDVVQEAVVEFLRYGPRFVPQSERQLQALLARIVASTICDQGNWFQAARRRMSRETRLETSAELDAGANAVRPDDVAATTEMSTRLRLAMELLPERDRLLLVWREWEKLSFADVAARAGLGTEEAARAAHRRAMSRLLEQMSRIRNGDLDGAIEEADG